VVDHHNLAGAVPAGVGVLFRRAAMGRPACVSDTVLPVDGSGTNGRLEIGELAGAAAKIDRAVANEGHARGVVAAVLQLSQSLDENADDVFRSDVSDDAAHVC